MKRPVLVFLLLAVCLASCSKKDTNELVSINIRVADSLNTIASVTGKYAFWRFNDFRKANQQGVIRFTKKIDAPELFCIKLNKSYSSMECYLEPGESIEVQYHDQQFEVLGNSLPARQNRLLQQLKQVRKSDMDRSISTDLTKPMETGRSVNRLIADFQTANPACSKKFIQYLRIDHRCSKVAEALNAPDLPTMTYVPFNPSQLELLTSTLNVSDQEMALLSSSYRSILFDYLDYLRIIDPRKKLGTDADFMKNEVSLSNYLNGNALQEYALAKNLLELQPYCCQDPKAERFIEYNGGSWNDCIQTERRNKLSQSTRPKVGIPFKPTLTGIDQKYVRFQLNDLKGKWVLLYFWSAKSENSLSELYYLQQIRKAFAESKLDIVGVSVDDLAYFPDWMNIVTSNRVVGRQLFCEDKASIFNQFGISSLPHFSICSPEGMVLYNNVPRPSTGMSHRLLQNLIRLN